ncbi:TfuA-like protein [Erythrobacter crassostreae]|uniref:TfuA-like core domain-containing protein n=1 Tax=Erythrobacter crassostreae TaxID=2828328 RepID=A0A9X1F6E5_9SPHN|nr:TfuA-like protein [Erythrobacter crassostrea]MBV7260308.1 hypothetical protein [Erythrobacter crassostrea]
MTDYVFLGPSLPQKAASEICDAVYLPPVAMGDIYKIVQTQCKPGDRIAIIDGLFEQVPAVWHKEILFAIDQGYPVFGASSMGALRAAELHPYGMIGVGRIYEAYRDGTIEDDDEVAVSHALREHGYRSLSTSMASIRFALEDALERQEIDPASAVALIDHAKKQHYFERNWGDLLEVAKGLEGFSEQREVLLRLARQPDAKAIDAERLLKLLSADEKKVPPPGNFTFQHTTFWQAFSMDRSLDGDGSRDILSDHIPSTFSSGIPEYFRAAGPERTHVLDLALLDRLIEVFAAEYKPTGRDIALAAANLNRELPKDVLGGPLGQLGKVALREQAEFAAQRDWLLSRLAAGLDPHILRRLVLRGDFAEFASLVTDEIDDQRKNGAEKASLESLGLGVAELEDWYRERCGRMTPDPEGHAKRLGFESLRQFVDCATVVFLADRKKDPQKSFANDLSHTFEDQE